MKNEQAGMPTKPLQRAFASTRQVLVQVRADQLAMRTPCASWDVRALIEHFIGSACWAMAAVDGSQAVAEDVADADFVTAYDQNITASATSSPSAIPRCCRRSDFRPSCTRDPGLLILAGCAGGRGG
jgi:Mycothiol maleylpyruvate isomerase N-terminal domain